MRQLVVLHPRRFSAARKRPKLEVRNAGTARDRNWSEQLEQGMRAGVGRYGTRINGHIGGRRLPGAAPEGTRMQITVIGTGYVGLVTGACLANLGHHVTCMDVDAQKVERLSAGDIPIYEPGLDELVATVREERRLTFSASYADAVPGADAIFICVGTPSLPGGQADTSYVETAARSLGEHLSPRFCVIINKSTVPIGSGDWVGVLVRQGISRRAASAEKVSTWVENGGTSSSG